MTDDELRGCICIWRTRMIAEPKGPRHAYWDMISDAEAILKSERSVRSRVEIERIICECGLDR